MSTPGGAYPSGQDAGEPQDPYAPSSGPYQPDGEYGQPPYGQAGYGQGAHPQAGYGQSPYGQYGYGQAPYGQSPYGQPAYPPAGYPPSPYVPQGYGYQPISAPGTNGMAIASMVLGILWIYWVGSILALIFGYVARSQMRNRPQDGGGMAIAGIVLGWIGVGTLLAVILVVVAASN